METRETTTREGCPTCKGSGIHRNGSFFFYAVTLTASASIIILEWSPTPELFQFVRRTCWSAGLPVWIALVCVYMVTAIPALVGLAFFFAWLRRDTCPRCLGRGKPQISQQTLDAIGGE